MRFPLYFPLFNLIKLVKHESKPIIKLGTFFDPGRSPVIQIHMENQQDICSIFVGRKIVTSRPAADMYFMKECLNAAVFSKDNNRCPIVGTILRLSNC